MKLVAIIRDVMKARRDGNIYLTPSQADFLMSILQFWGDNKRLSSKQISVTNQILADITRDNIPMWNLQEEKHKPRFF